MATRRKPNTDKKQKIPTHVVPTISLLNLPGTIPPIGTLCPLKKVEETVLKLLELSSAALIDNDAVLANKTPLAEKEVGEDPTAAPRPKRPAYLGQTELNESKPKGYDHVFTHFPTDPNREVCRMTKTTRARCENRLLRRADGVKQSG